MIWSPLWAKLRGQLKGDLMCRRVAVAGTVLMLVTILCAVNPVGAHVMLDYPNGGEVLEAGTVAAIEWRVLKHGPFDRPGPTLSRVAVAL